jgi:RNA polymerase sigma factor (sigma-70 family)
MQQKYQVLANPDFFSELKQENEQRIRTVYKLLFPQVEKKVLLNNGNHQDARDVFQEALVAFLHKIKSPDFIVREEGAWVNYLLVTCRNIWLEELRRRKKYKKPLPDFALPDLPQINLPDEYENQTAKMLDKMVAVYDKLGSRCRELLQLIYHEGKTAKEAGAMLGYAESFVRLKKHRCMEKMRSQLIHHKADN